MIVFQTSEVKINFTNKGIRFNEESDFFSNQTSKSFSFPFNVKLDSDVAVLLGLVNISSVRSYKSKIYGYLTIDSVFYDAYIAIGEIKNNQVELTIYYGKEVLPVFDKKLNQLPFGVTNTASNLPTFAKAQLNKSWPEATHNFPKMFREDISQKSNYTYFENFVNNYINDGGWDFPVNTIDLIEGENVAVNRNVMCPFPYLMEIFKVIFASEGLEIRGDFVNDDFYKKVCLVPKNYFEQYAVSQFDNYSFSTFTSQETINGTTINVYQKQHTPLVVGSYSLKFRLNLSNAIAQYFHLKITHGSNTLYEASSTNKQVTINEEISLNIINTTVFDPIIVVLKLSYQAASIVNFNSFTYQHKEGQLNVFPTAYNIADFMPDMKVRDFINKIKSWFNLKFDYTDNAVSIDFLDDYVNALVFEDKSHLESPDVKRVINKNNLFKLTYKDGSEVMVDKNGQTYSDKDFSDSEIETIDIEALPLKVIENYNVVTAVYPNDDTDLMFCLYDGTVASENIAVDSINGVKLDLQHQYDLRWSNWLRFRANAEILKDTFFAHVWETFNFKNGIFKYNKNQLAKSISKKRVNDLYWEIEVESETL